jgi:signal transduction histidine kinase
LAAVNRLSARDVLPALGLTLFTLAGTHGAAAHHPSSTDYTLAYVLAGIAAATILARRLAPAPMLLLCSGLVSAYLAADYVFGPVFIALGVVSFAAARHLPADRARTVWPAALGVLAVGLAIRFARDPGWGAAIGLTASTGWLIVPWSVGTQRRLHREVRLRAKQDEAERAVTTERLRIAAEVHDVAGHGLAVIAMQAGVALHVLDRRPEQARVALEEIRAASTEALDGLRATLGELRTADGTAPRTPGAPGLDALPALCDRIRRAGLAVDLDVLGAAPDPAASGKLGATVYRIVQESLTNVLRHANANRASVTLIWSAQDLVLRVTDDGVGAVGAPGAGLAGMRERAARLGGTLDTGPAPGGGFAVTAVLPR